MLQYKRMAGENFIQYLKKNSNCCYNYVGPRGLVSYAALRFTNLTFSITFFLDLPASSDSGSVHA